MKSIVTVFWKVSLPGISSLRIGSCTDWRIERRDDVSLLIIRQEENLRHEIPFDNILYWSVDTVVTNDSVGDKPKDRYCATCEVFFGSGRFIDHPITTHDVRRTCCGTSPQRDHHPSCSNSCRIEKGNQRIGTITDISEDKSGLKVTANLNRPGTEWLEHFFDPSSDFPER